MEKRKWSVWSCQDQAESHLEYASILSLLVEYDFGTEKSKPLLKLKITEIQCPSFDKLPLIDFSSKNLIYFSAWGASCGTLNFSEPAKSTILNYVD